MQAANSRLYIKTPFTIIVTSGVSTSRVNRGIELKRRCALQQGVDAGKTYTVTSFPRKVDFTI